MLTSNTYRARCGRAVLTLALFLAWTGAIPVICWAADGQRAARGADPAARAQAADQLEKLLKAMDIASRDIPRDSFDPQAVLETVGRDPQALAEWVRKNTTWAPYQGALRGPAGVLMDRLGNSLDRALLLAVVLKLAGHEARLASAELPAQTAQQLLPTLRQRLIDAPKANAPAKGLADQLEQLAQRTGLNVTSLRDQYQRQLMQHDKYVEDLTARTTEQVPVLAAAIGQTPPNTADDSAALAALRSHYWVQLSGADGWIDLDPLTEDGKLAQAGLTPAETIEVNTSKPLDSIKLEQSHRVTIRVMIESLDGGALKRQQAMEYTFRPAEMLGTSIVIRHQLADGKDLLAGTGGDPAKVKAVAKDHKKWVPYIAVGNAPFADKAFDAYGQLSKPPEAEGAGKLGGQVGGMFGGLSGDEGAEPTSVLVGEYLEYTLLVPGSDPVIIRRDVFDLLGPAGRTDSTLKAFKISDEQKARRALALRGETEVLPMASRLSADYVDHTVIRALLADGPALLQSLKANPSVKPAPTLPQPIPSGALYDLARLRFDNSAHADKLFIARPNLLTYQRQFTLNAKDEFLQVQGFDIVANELASRGGAGAFDARIAQGVLETNAEDLLMRRNDGNGATHGAASSVSAALDAGQGVLCFRNAQDLAKATFASDVAVRMNQAIDAGYWVVAAPNSAGGFYRVDPKTGNTLGIGERGWGSAITEKQVLTGIIAIGTLLMCFEGQLGRTHAQHREGAETSTLIIVCAGVAIGTCFGNPTFGFLLASMLVGLGTGLATS